jgi:hypothetical protein
LVEQIANLAGAYDLDTHEVIQELTESVKENLYIPGKTIYPYFDDSGKLEFSLFENDASYAAGKNSSNRDWAIESTPKKLDITKTHVYERILKSFQKRLDELRRYRKYEDIRSLKNTVVKVEVEKVTPNGCFVRYQSANSSRWGGHKCFFPESEYVELERINGLYEEGRVFDVELNRIVVKGNGIIHPYVTRKSKLLDKKKVDKILGGTYRIYDIYRKHGDHIRLWVDSRPTKAVLKRMRYYFAKEKVYFNVVVGQ